MSDVQFGDGDLSIAREDVDEEVGAPTPAEIEEPGFDDSELDEDGDDLGAFAQSGVDDFAGAEVSPAGGVDAEIGGDEDAGEDEADDAIGAGDLEEGVEDFEDEDATP